MQYIKRPEVCDKRKGANSSRYYNHKQKVKKHYDRLNSFFQKQKVLNLVKIRDLRIKLPVLDRDTLEAEALVSYTKHTGRFIPHLRDEDILHMSVKYLRHSSNYEDTLNILRHKFKSFPAYLKLSKLVFAEIIKQYPYLKETCEAEMRWKENHYAEHEDQHKFFVGKK